MMMEWRVKSVYPGRLIMLFFHRWNYGLTTVLSVIYLFFLIIVVIYFMDHENLSVKTAIHIPLSFVHSGANQLYIMSELVSYIELSAKAQHFLQKIQLLLSSSFSRLFCFVRIITLHVLGPACNFWKITITSGNEVLFWNWVTVITNKTFLSIQQQGHLECQWVQHGV